MHNDDLIDDFPIHQFWGTRVDLKPELFDTAIIQKGMKVIWEQTMFCSCYSQRSGQPGYNCPACKGNGYVYFGRVLTKALITGISGRKDQDRIGLNELGTAYLTTLTSDNVGFRDRFTFLDFTMKYSQVLTRGNVGENDDLAYEARSIISVRMLNTVYVPDVDYTLSEDHMQIIWINNPIPTGKNYSILYNTPPVYIATNPVHELRGTYSMWKHGGAEVFTPLPKQFQIKRVDFLDG